MPLGIPFLRKYKLFVILTNQIACDYFVKVLSLAMYLPSISNSIFTIESISISAKLVFSFVYGIIATLKLLFVGSHTVSETPFTVTEPLSTVKYPLCANWLLNGYSNVK